MLQERHQIEKDKGVTPLHLKDASLPSSGTQACTPASLGVERGPDSRMQRMMLWLGPRAPMLEPQMPQRLTQSKRPAQHLWASVSSRATRLMHLKGFGKGLKYSTNIKNPSWRPEENPIKGRGPEHGGIGGTPHCPGSGRGVWKGTERPQVPCAK